MIGRSDRPKAGNFISEHAGIFVLLSPSSTHFVRPDILKGELNNNKEDY